MVVPASEGFVDNFGTGHGPQPDAGSHRRERRDTSSAHVCVPAAATNTSITPDTAYFHDPGLRAAGKSEHLANCIRPVPRDMLPRPTIPRADMRNMNRLCGAPEPLFKTGVTPVGR